MSKSRKEFNELLVQLDALINKAFKAADEAHEKAAEAANIIDEASGILGQLDAEDIRDEVDA